ncbi:(2Fe-2S)-binding protein [Sphaerisporangium fuscum]|uniref:(2Fe-2S)-binding protein n=1 Tax=Sphaerisporangium fuscum TaxID=2835868 RepID=UPI001BDD3F34|nr:(2Fe-2S)-binding protein [Sphaerisporangium fuscum]
MRADPELVGRALAEVSAVGPYFELRTDPGVEDDLTWRPLGELSTDTDALRAKIADHGRRLGTRENRVAASILFQGLAARLWSPVVATVAAHGLLPVGASAHLRWRPVPTGPLPLWASRTAGWELLPDPADRAERVYRAVVPELLEPLVAAVQGITKISAALLWGNAASALAGTLRTLPPARPDLGPAAARLVRDVLRVGLLAGTGEPAEPAPGEHFFVRTSCCLYYRVPGGGMCDDCALLDPEIRRAQWARTVRAAGGAR